MKNHTDLINHLLQLRGRKSYLEIGTFNPDHNFNKIQAARKVSIDPDLKANAMLYVTIDEYFRLFPDQKYSCIFIDGLHHEDQVQKDFENSLHVLDDDGFIVMHDCNPHKESITHVPRDSREWCGDVYKFASTLGEYAGISFVTVDFDYGCCVAWRNPTMLSPSNVGEVTWGRFEKEKKELLHLISVDEFLNLKL